MQTKKEYKQAKDLHIYTAVWRLFKPMDLAMRRMDKDHKHVYGQELIHKIIEMVTLIGNANRETDAEMRCKYIRELIDKYNSLTSLFRFCVESGFLGVDGQKIYVEVIPLFANIERQANGWMLDTMKRTRVRCAKPKRLKVIMRAIYYHLQRIVKNKTK